MPIPFAQADPAQTDIQDTAGMQPAADIPSTYISRGLDTLQSGFVGEAYRGVVGAELQRDGSDMLSKEVAKAQYGPTFDGPVSRDYARFESAQDAITSNLKDTMARGGSSSASKTWLGFGVAQAAGLLDPLQDGAAILSDGITKFAPIRPGFILGPATSRLAARTLAGVQTAATFSGLTEPLHYALDDNWSLEDAAQRLGSGALFLGLTHGLFGQTPLKFYSEDKDIPTPQDQATYKLLEDHLQPQTNAAMAEASASRAKSGAVFDPINDLIGLDPRIVEHEAKLGGVALPLEERAKVLASMDDGTYKDPSIPEEESKVTLPSQESSTSLAQTRVKDLQDKLSTESTQNPASISVAPHVEPEKQATDLLAPYEKEEPEPLAKTEALDNRTLPHLQNLERSLAESKLFPELKNRQSMKEIVKEEKMKEPGYNQAIRCVTGTI